jgi:predicted metal-dependent hydrolase
MEAMQFEYGNKTFSYEVSYSDRTTLGIKVYPSSEIKVQAPLSASKEIIEQKVKQKARWIDKQVSQFQKYLPATPPRRYVNGESHLYLGRQYRLMVLLSNEPCVKLHRGVINVYVPYNDPSIIKETLEKWYKGKANIVFTDLYNQLKSNFTSIKIDHSTLQIKSMSKRWGSCSPKGRISLNVNLIKAPKPCIEYVIIHELCHLVYFDHGKKFQKLLREKISDWEKWKDRLEMVMV